MKMPLPVLQHQQRRREQVCRPQLPPQMIAYPPRQKQAVSAILPRGAASAVDSLTLVNMLGYKDRRELTQQIERERQAGSPICAVTSGDHRGYFLPVDAGELAQYISSIDRRIRAISRTRNACGETLRRMIGQEQIEGW